MVRIHNKYFRGKDDPYLVFLDLQDHLVSMAQPVIHALTCYLLFPQKLDFFGSEKKIDCGVYSVLQ